MSSFRLFTLTLTNVVLCPQRYAKEAISIAPNNPSAWNYLRGVLDLTHTPYTTLRTFVQPYTTKRDPDAPLPEEVDLDDPLPGEGAQLPCPAAIEFLAEVMEADGQESVKRAVTVGLYTKSYERRGIINASIIVIRVPCSTARHNPQEVSSCLLPEHGCTDSSLGIGNSESRRPSMPFKSDDRRVNFGFCMYHRCIALCRQVPPDGHAEEQLLGAYTGSEDALGMTTRVHATSVMPRRSTDSLGS